MSAPPDCISSGVMDSTCGNSEVNDSSSGSDLDEHDVDSDSSQGGEDAEMLRAMREGISDMYGTSEIPPQRSFSRQEIKTAREQLRTLLQQPPPQARPSAYMEAQEKVPQLVKTESNPEHFLRACNFDHQQASEFLFSYWRTRHEAFGARAFSPLSRLCGGGALFTTDLAVLKRGGYAILPPDQHNRPVVFVDRSKISEDPKNQARLLFLIFQVLMRNPLALRNGTVWTMVMDNSPQAQASKISPRNRPYPSIFRMIQSWPIQVRALHMIVIGKHKSRLMEYTVPAWSVVLDRWQSLSLRSETHVVKVSSDAMRKLENYGLVSESMPRSLGGSLNVESHVNTWFQELVECKILEQPLNLEELHRVRLKDKSPSRKRKACDIGLRASKSMNVADGNGKTEDKEKESLLQENAMLKEHIARQDAYYKKREEMLVGQRFSSYWPVTQPANTRPAPVVRNNHDPPTSILNQVRFVADSPQAIQAINRPGTATLSTPFVSIAQASSISEAPTAATLAAQIYGQDASTLWSGPCPTQPGQEQQEFPSLPNHAASFQPLFRGQQSPLASWQQSVIQSQPPQDNDAAINAIIQAAIQSTLLRRQQGHDGQP